MSKSHGNTSMYADTVINFAKITTYIHILHTYVCVCTYVCSMCMYVVILQKLPHTYTYYIHTYIHILHTTYRISDHIVSFLTTFRRDNKYIQVLCPPLPTTTPLPAPILTCPLGLHRIDVHSGPVPHLFCSLHRKSVGGLC